jgi:hypothetical protein
VNVNGGGIALGHPIGTSGARIVLHLTLKLRRRGGGIGAVALCGGGGQRNALIVGVPRQREGPLEVVRRLHTAQWRGPLHVEDPTTAGGGEPWHAFIDAARTL